MMLSLAVSDGGFVFTSGMVGIAPDGSVPPEPEDEFRLLFSNLADVLAQVGVSFDDVVEMTNFLCGDFATLHPIFQKVRAEVFTNGFPASTSVGVAQLLDPRFHVEVKLTASRR
jgi:enamine deaminase RidA (YjgF/YER057c/UK114 family)